MLSLWMTWVQFLVRELRSHKAYGTAEKTTTTKKTLAQSSENWRSSRKLTVWLMSSSGSEILLRSPGVRPRGSQITRQISKPQALYHLLRWRQCVWKALADRSVSSTSRSGAGWESAFTRLCPAPSLISPYLNSPNQSFHSHMLGTTVKINRTLAKGAGVVWWTDTWGIPSLTQLPSPGSWHPYVPIAVSSLVLRGPLFFWEGEDSQRQAGYCTLIAEHWFLLPVSSGSP